jgi:ribosomal protein L29
MTAEQIDAEVAATKRALFDLRLKRATRQEHKSSDFKFNKKKVRVSAAIHTANRSRAPAQKALPRWAREVWIRIGSTGDGELCTGRGVGALSCGGSCGHVQVAVLLTVKREAELAEGLNKRDSRIKNQATSLRQGAKF